MNYITILPLLLMGTSGVLGHSIKKLEINNKTEADVYEIKEDSATNTVAFVNPKGDTPTLREIVYYHMVERPYGPDEGRVRYESEGGPEIDETMRPFTNSHGFPFLETVEKELDIESQNELKEDIPEEKGEVLIEYIPNEDDEVYEVIYDEEFPVDIKITKQEESKEIPTTVASEIVKEVSTEAKMDETTDTIIKEKSEHEVDVIETSSIPETKTKAHLIEEPTQAMTVTEIPITTSVTEEPVYEKKAKTARKLLFDLVKERYYSKPNETQNTSSTAERRKREINNMHIPEAPKLGEINYDSLPPYLRRLISTEKPMARINSDSESDEEERLDDIKHRMHKLMSTLKTADSLEEKPRTYGMNLTADSGYIWNDMTNPGIHYEVEASESIEEEIKEPSSNVKPKTFNHDQDKHERSNEDKSHEKNQKEDKHSRDSHNDDHERTSETTEDGLNTSFEGKGRKRNKHKDNDDMNQLMENDQFWKWLADWTSVYMDILADHIKEAVHQEVEEQLKTQAEEHNKDSKVPVEQKDIPKDLIENDLDKPEDKDSDKHDDKMTTTEPVVDIVTEKNKPGNDNNSEKSNVDEKDLLKRKDENPIIKDKEIIKDDTKEENKQKETAKIEAQNVYGNTIGDKVTNIFIFYPNQDADKVIKDISKLNHSNNVQIDVRLNVPDEDKKDDIPPKDASTQAPIENNKEVSNDITTEVPKESSKTSDDSKHIEEKTNSEAILEVPTTNTQQATTTEQIDLKNTENELTTESSKVESTTEPEKQDLPTDKIGDNPKEPKNDEKSKKEPENKTMGSETEQNEKHETIKTDNEVTTEKYETKDQNEEAIVSSTIIDKPEMSTEPSI